jgi:hypothetical protein
MLFWYCFQIFFRPLVTIPVAPVITSTKKHFMFHIRWISILQFLYFNFFSDSFCITFPSDGIATSISKQILSFLFLIIMSGLFARTSLSVCNPWFHSTVISSCWHTGLGGITSFVLFQCLMFCILNNVYVYRLYRVLLRIIIVIIIIIATTRYEIGRVCSTYEGNEKYILAYIITYIHTYS